MPLKQLREGQSEDLREFLILNPNHQVHVGRLEEQSIMFGLSVKSTRTLAFAGVFLSLRLLMVFFPLLVSVDVHAIFDVCCGIIVQLS